MLRHPYHCSIRLYNAPLLLASNPSGYGHQETDDCNCGKGSFACLFADLHLGHSMANSVDHILAVQRSSIFNNDD